MFLYIFVSDKVWILIQTWKIENMWLSFFGPSMVNSYFRILFENAFIIKVKDDTQMFSYQWFLHPSSTTASRDVIDSSDYKFDLVPHLVLLCIYDKWSKNTAEMIEWNLKSCYGQ